MVHAHALAAAQKLLASTASTSVDRPHTRPNSQRSPYRSGLFLHSRASTSQRWFTSVDQAHTHAIGWLLALSPDQHMSNKSTSMVRATPKLAIDIACAQCLPAQLKGSPPAWSKHIPKWATSIACTQYPELASLSQRWPTSVVCMRAQAGYQHSRCSPPWGNRIIYLN